MKVLEGVMIFGGRVIVLELKRSELNWIELNWREEKRREWIREYEYVRVCESMWEGVEETRWVDEVVWNWSEW